MCIFKFTKKMDFINILPINKKNEVLFFKKKLALTKCMSLNSPISLNILSCNTDGLCAGFSLLWLNCMMNTYGKKIPPVESF